MDPIHYLMIIPAVLFIAVLAWANYDYWWLSSPEERRRVEEDPDTQAW